MCFVIWFGSLGLWHWFGPRSYTYVAPICVLFFEVWFYAGPSPKVTADSLTQYKTTDKKKLGQCQPSLNSFKVFYECQPAYLAAQVSFSDHIVRRPSLCLSVLPYTVRLYFFFFFMFELLQEHWANFNQTWHFS